MSDTETLSNIIPKKNTEKVSENTKDQDFPIICVNIIKKINFKISIFLFFIGVFVFSNVFIDNFLPKNTIDGFCANTKGTVIQLLVLVILYILLDLMVQAKII